MVRTLPQNASHIRTLQYGMTLKFGFQACIILAQYTYLHIILGHRTSVIEDIVVVVVTPVQVTNSACLVASPSRLTSCRRALSSAQLVRKEMQNDMIRIMLALALSRSRDPLSSAVCTAENVLESSNNARPRAFSPPAPHHGPTP